jgi:hypothetical protein
VWMVLAQDRVQWQQTLALAVSKLRVLLPGTSFDIIPIRIQCIVWKCFYVKIQ